MRSMTSMLVRRLVSGVRSSWEASATSWRCSLRDTSSAPSMALKLVPSRSNSRPPLGSTRRERSPVARTSSASSVSRWTGRRAVRPTRRPRNAATATPAAAMRKNTTCSQSSTWLTSATERAASTIRPSWVPTAMTRTGCPSARVSK